MSKGAEAALGGSRSPWPPREKKDIYFVLSRGLAGVWLSEAINIIKQHQGQASEKQQGEPTRGGYINPRRQLAPSTAPARYHISSLCFLFGSLLQFENVGEGVT